MVVLAGITASVLLFQGMRDREQRLIEMEFESDASEDVRALEIRLERIFEAVHGMAGFYEGSDEVTWEEFRTFAEPFLDRHQGLEALVWVPRVADEHREAFQSTMGPGGESFQIREQTNGELVSAAQRNAYFPIHFMLADEEHEWLLGFDLASREELREALERARAGDRAVATRPLTLVSEGGEAPRLWVFHPVEEKPVAFGDLGELEGFVGGAFRTEDMLEGFLPVASPRDMIFEIRDLDAPSDRDLIYSTQGDFQARVNGPGTGTPVDQDVVPQEPGPTAGHVRIPVHRDLVELAGRRWSIQAQPTQRYLEARVTRTPLLVLGSGVGAALLLGLYLNTVLARTEEVERQVARRTRALRREIEQRRQLASELTGAEQRERRELARTLHDHMQQLLVAAKMKVEIAATRTREEAPRAPLQEATEHIDQAIAEARTLSHELSPPMLQREGLVPTLRWLAGRMEEHHGLRVEMEAGESLPALSEDVASFVFQSVRELLFNVVKHAETDRARLELAAPDPEGPLRITVEDEGTGMTPDETASGRSRGFGLESIRERLHDLGGELRAEGRAEGSGTVVTMVVPVGRE